MSLHRVTAPPPLALAVHPAPPPKTREEIRKADEKRRADRDAKAKAEAEKKAGDDVGKVKGGEKDGEVQAVQKATPAKEIIDPKANSGDKDVTPVLPATVEGAAPVAKPLPPLRLLPPVPHRPVRSRLDLDPSRPYPPIISDPRGAYNSYAQAMLGEVLYVDVTKDGWLTEQWREKSEREALARLTGDADKQRMREVAKAKNKTVARKVPATAQGLILELWNDLVESKAYEVSVDAFWAKYDWTNPKAEKHLQIMPFEEKEKAKAAEIARVEKELKEEEIATLARRAAREKDRLAEEEKEKRKKDKEDDNEKGEDGKKEKRPELEERKVVNEKLKLEVSEKDKVEETRPMPSDGDRPAVVEEVQLPSYNYPVDVEWTREGVEETLATVGVQCAFNTEKPLPKHWSTPTGAYLLLAHNHFLLRVESHIIFKPDGPSEKFEAIVTHTDDRVFGEMAKKQLAAEKKKKDREYRDRKEREYKEKKEKERNERKEKERDAGVEKKESNSPASDKPGENEIAKPMQDEEQGPSKPAADLPGNDEILVGKGKSDLHIVVVPVKDPKDKEKGLDAKHEEEAVLVGLKVEKISDTVRLVEMEVANSGEKEEADKKKEAKIAEEKKAALAKQHRHKEPGFDPVRDADLLIKMFGPEAANIPLADLKAAFVAMEQAAADQKAKAAGDKKEGPMIWEWDEPCERWRWKNFAVGCAVIEAGGWEERDWKVFADDSGVVEFEQWMEWEEILERDNHDWTC